MIATSCSNSIDLFRRLSKSFDFSSNFRLNFLTSRFNDLFCPSRWGIYFPSSSSFKNKSNQIIICNYIGIYYYVFNKDKKLNHTSSMDCADWLRFEWDLLSGGADKALILINKSINKWRFDKQVAKFSHHGYWLSDVLWQLKNKTWCVFSNDHPTLYLRSPHSRD